MRLRWLCWAVLWAGCGPAAAPPPPTGAPPAAVPVPAAVPAPAPVAAPNSAAEFPPLPAANPERFPQPFAGEPAPVSGTVAFVADGDTLRIRLADRSVMVRLLGVNTPEKESKYREREPWGERVAAIARERWLGKRVELVADLTKTDQYDRVLGYVALDGADQGAWLLRQGYARVFVPAPHPRRAAYWR
ncbi:MAG: thermonuclease family protein, partial [Planctomycetota bacterium]